MSSWGVFWVVFFSILREGFETVVMLLAQDRGDGFSFIGFILGAALALYIGYLVVALGKKINLRPFLKALRYYWYFWHPVWLLTAHMKLKSI